MFCKILKKIAQKLGWLLSRMGSGSLLESWLTVSKSLDKASNNVNFDINNNGELRVLKILAKFQPKCVFDVGANVGEYTNIVVQTCPGCLVHSFEIVPDTFGELVNNVKSKNVRFVNKGLSDSPGIIDIHVSKRESTTATAFRIDGMKAHEHYYSEGEVHKCEVITGDSYLAQQGINEIDFLKVDVEGMDYRVLSGFRESLSKIKVIQFEYGIFNISSKDLLVDFYRLLSESGFVVGKIMPKGVIFRDYHFSMEDFYGNNYIAVRKGEQELISELGFKMIVSR
jgi:FkbM family methyltransferase